MLRQAHLRANPSLDPQGALWGTFLRRFGNGRAGCYGGSCTIGDWDKSLMDISKFMLIFFLIKRSYDDPIFHGGPLEYAELI